MIKLEETDAPILVTGASGFLGEHLVRCMVRNSIPVVGTYLVHPVAIPRADVIAVDLRDHGAMHRLIRDLKPSAVVHCAAMTDAAACEKDEVSARVAIVDSANHLSAAIGELAPGTPVVGISTDLVFNGDAAPYGPDDQPKPISIYGGLKWQAERPVLSLQHGAVLRAALIYGPPVTHKGSFLAWMRKALSENCQLGLFEDEYRTPVYVDDLCEAILGVIEQELTGIWHAGGPERLDRMKMGRRVCQIWGFDENLLTPRRLAESDYAAPRPRDVSLSSARTWETIGLKPKNFTEGLESVREAEHKT